MKKKVLPNINVYLPLLDTILGPEDYYELFTMIAERVGSITKAANVIDVKREKVYISEKYEDMESRTRLSIINVAFLLFPEEFLEKVKQKIDELTDAFDEMLYTLKRFGEFILEAEGDKEDENY